MEIDFKVIVSVYAAIVSTVVFVWRLYEFYDDKKGKMKVSLSKISQVPMYYNHSLGQWEEFIVATIINIGKHKRQIERPSLKVIPKINDQEFFNVIVFESPNFPLGLEPGQKFEYKLPIASITEFRSKGVNKIKCKVVDTHGDFYESPWHDI